MNDIHPGDTVWVRTDDGPKRGVLFISWPLKDLAIVEFHDGLIGVMWGDIYKSKEDCKVEKNE